MLKSPISVLQEYIVQKRLPMPEYEMTGFGASHEPTFKCTVKVGSVTATAKGLSKKEAKHNAAVMILKDFNIKADGKEVPSICLLPTITSKMNAAKINYVGKLNEFCSGNRYLQPEYVEDCFALNGLFTMTCKFQEYSTKGTGPTKKDAKQDSARQMLYLIKDKNLEFDKVSLQEDQYAVSTDTDEVLDKYEMIIRNFSASTEINNNTEESSDKPFLPSTFQELTQLCSERGWHQELKVFQEKPLMFILKINDYTLIEYGENREEIEAKLVVSVSKLLHEGINFDERLK